MDTKILFLNGKLTKDIYMALPKGFEHAKLPNKVCKLENYIYGLKPASRNRNIFFLEKLKEFVFSISDDQSCVYVEARGV